MISVSVFALQFNSFFFCLGLPSLPSHDSTLSRNRAATGKRNEKDRGFISEDTASVLFAVKAEYFFFRKDLYECVVYL